MLWHSMEVMLTNVPLHCALLSYNNCIDLCEDHHNQQMDHTITS